MKIEQWRAESVMGVEFDLARGGYATDLWYLFVAAQGCADRSTNTQQDKSIIVTFCSSSLNPKRRASLRRSSGSWRKPEALENPK